VDWPALPEGRTLQQTDELVSGNGVIYLEADSPTSPWQLTPAITGGKTAAKRRVWHLVHGMVMCL